MTSKVSYVPKLVGSKYLAWKRKMTDVIRSNMIEKWNGKKPDISNFKVFGYECWAHIHDDKRKKLDPKSHKCIFIGYSEDSKAYRLFDTSTHSVII